MTHNHSPKHFAKALYSVAEQKKALESVYNSLRQIIILVKTVPDFRGFVQSKRIEKDKKKKIIDNVFGDAIHPLVIELLLYLKGSEAKETLLNISTFFNRFYKDNLDIVIVKGTLASKVSDDEKSKLKLSIEKILGKNAELYLDVDESIIGGIRLRIENTLLDATVKNQLKNLHSKMIQS